MTVAFKTFGCRLNRAEALDQEAAFSTAGYEVVDLAAADSSHAPGPDLIIVRGCSVTARAQRDCEKEIDRLHIRYPNAEIRITGCLPNAIHPQPPPSPPTSHPSPRTSRAYLKVQDGCSGRCAFCIVPQFRGPPVSVPFDDVLTRARAFLAVGFRELVVTGCNLALYRSRNHGLPDLLSALAELSPQSLHPTPSPQPPTFHRIRLGSLEPGICDDALLDAFAEHPNICRFIHLSLQSGSDTVLKRMNRPYTVDTVARFCSNAFSRLGPRLSLGADVIAGFPSETNDDHLMTQTLLSRDWGRATETSKLTNCTSTNHHTPHQTPHTKHLFFSNLHVFPYSERPGTAAATLDGALPRSVRLARARELEELGRRQRAAFAHTFIGQTVEVCVERGGDHGWTAEYLSCRLQDSAPRRNLVAVHVDAVAGDSLLGHAV